MLLPDNIQPELSIYYNGAIVLQTLKKEKKQAVFELYTNVKKTNNMSFGIFILSLDWLYIIDIAKIDEKGWVELCL